MFLIILICLVLPASGTHRDYSIGGPERADFINPQVFFPCLRPIHDPEYGVFEPLLFVLYPIAIPPIAACPEIVNKNTVRFLAISRRDPTRITSVDKIEKGSKVSMIFHGYITEYDSTIQLAMALSLLRESDWVILVDWDRMADPRVLGRIRIPPINGFLSSTNTILLGRISCEFIKFLADKRKIQIEDIFLVSFSSGGQSFSTLANYCDHKYGIKFYRMLAIEESYLPFRRSNYALANHTSAKFFEVIFTTKSPNFPVVDEILSFFTIFGYFEVEADCAYIVNPEQLFTGQGPCLLIPPSSGCSHLFALQVFLSVSTGHCLYRYGPCPDYIGLPSNQEIGLTKFNCADHPYLRRTCITTSWNPLISC